MMDAYNNSRTLSSKESISDLKKGVPSAAEPQHDEENEEDEPLLVENKNRFVLFPIKYHEVCNDRIIPLTPPPQKKKKKKKKKRC